jgi:hypothetical protein
MSTVAAHLPTRSGEGLVLSLETVLAAAAGCIVALWFAASTPAALHWFVLPVTLCGVLVGGDAIRWLRGKIGAFDPAGVLGMIGVHLFFLAPLLHVRWDFWMRYVQSPSEWRDWLGAMAIVNCCALIAYRAGRAWCARMPVRLRARRELDPRRFWILLVPTLLIAAALQYWVYERVGGILGYIRAYTQPGEAFQGYGFTFLISESFPILGFIGFAVLATRYRRLNNWWVIALVLLAFFALKILFGGLRGSRSNTVWGLFWAIGIIHLWIRPLSRRALLAGIPVLTAFMFGYGLYKAAGLDGVSALFDPPRALALARRSGRTIHSTVLSDLSRADVQAYVLYRLQTGASENLAWGRTYVGGLAILIPRRVLPARPPTKSKEGTDILYGRGTYESGRSSKRVFGLAGEAMLNVGLAGVPVAFLFFGVFVGWLRRAYYGLRKGDVRLLLLPLLINLALIMLIGDSDNVVFFFVKEASLPFLLLFLCSRSVRTAPVQGET